MSTHLLVYVLMTDPPENKSTCWCYFLSANHDGRFPVNEDGYIKVSDQEDSATWLMDVPVHQPTCSF